MRPSHSQVLIVGAGPAGLTLALELRRAGVGIRIIDKAPQRPDSESRAIGLHPPSIEAFARNKTAAPFLDAGMALRAANFYSSGERVLRIGLECGKDRPYPFSLLVQQGKSERFLIERLRELGVEIERPVPLEAFAQTVDGATAVLRRADGRLEEARFDYIAGCDGAHSLVRQSLGVGFDGRSLEGRFATGDLAIDFPDETRWPEQEIHTLLRAGRFAIFGKLRDGNWRVVVDLTDRPNVTADSVAVADLRNGLAAFPEFDGVLRDPQWISVFRVSSRVAETLRKGRVFLLGDAAHIHSPESGQGMNAGVQDAINLAWKLAAVVKGVASPELLDSYEDERLPIMRAIVRETELAQRAISLESPTRIALRDLAAESLGRLRPIQNVLTAAFTATAFHYRDSTIVDDRQQSSADYLGAIISGGPFPNCDQRRAFRTAPAPGDWAPDAAGLVLPDGSETSLHRLMANDLSAIVVILGGVDPKPSDLVRLAELVARLKVDHEGFLEPFLVTREATPGVLHDKDGALHKRYGAKYECLFLIRPDGFIGFRSQPALESPLRRYLADKLRIGQSVRAEPLAHGPA
ncbi:FAD-dependent monooxygenase [Methylosinus sp. KRF6]|uniref:FAD-dependent monooxygenase n=1 Tax=Methylosinus sp. KRF6 TaxID=2846853 RepID=UPI001C0D6E73|nr:FAD-dependent monooxygenase [Methylosinus sp. KRF6]MBU3887901.1 FAD-dependent monooxygenase [Methylosinus sp. KRF6]